MSEYALQKLTQLLIEEDFKNRGKCSKTTYMMTKQELIRFCIRLVKLIVKYECQLDTDIDSLFDSKEEEM